MTLDELLLEWCYRSERGYPSVDNPSDVSTLKQILKELNLSEQDVEDVLNNLPKDKPGGDDLTTPGTDGMEDSSVEKAKEKKEFTKKDLIDLINKTDISSQQLSDLSKRISNVLYLFISSDAVFIPIPGTPGILSDESPHIPSISITW